MGAVRHLILAGVIAALAAGGCATARAKTAPEPPSLEVPAPPPRVIVPPEPEPAAPVTLVPDTEPSQQKSGSNKPRVRQEPRPDPARTQKTEPPPPPAVETARPVAPPPTVAPLLQAPSATPTEGQVREWLKQASADLLRVNYTAMNADGKSQYDTAKLFIKQAEQALAEKNLVFAAKVAEKAAGLAASLPLR
jgi:pyruvate dehydrogenase E2 component (dihydrolipoamide acetyltransferase)